MLAAPTEVQEQKVEETVFPDQLSLRVFLKRVEEAALSNRVKREKIPLVLELIKEHFGKNLPELNWPPDF